MAYTLFSVAILIGECTDTPTPPPITIPSNTEI